LGLALLSWVGRASVISASSSTSAQAVGSARPCRSLAASRRRGIILCGLTLSHIPKVFPLLRVLIRLRRRGVSILRLITFWLDVGHVDLPEWLQETKRQGSRPFLRLRYTKSLNRLRELTDDPRPATRKRGLLGRAVPVVSWGSAGCRSSISVPRRAFETPTCSARLFWLA